MTLEGGRQYTFKGRQYVFKGRRWHETWKGAMMPRECDMMFGGVLIARVKCLFYCTFITCTQSLEKLTSPPPRDSGAEM